MSGTPTNVEYIPVVGNPTEQDNEEATQITCDYLEEFFTEFFATNVDTTMEQFRCSRLSSGSDPPQIKYDVAAFFSGRIPTAFEVDLILQSALNPPFSNDLVEKLQDLDPSNPYSQTTAIGYTVDGELQKSSETGMAGSSRSSSSMSPSVILTLSFGVAFISFFAGMTVWGQMPVAGYSIQSLPTEDLDSNETDGFDSGGEHRSRGESIDIEFGPSGKPSSSSSLFERPFTCSLSSAAADLDSDEDSGRHTIFVDSVSSDSMQ